MRWVGLSSGQVEIRSRIGVLFLDVSARGFSLMDTLIGLFCILSVAFLVVGAVGKLLFGDQ
jgi:hypothetical protein